MRSIESSKSSPWIIIDLQRRDGTPAMPCHAVPCRLASARCTGGGGGAHRWWVVHGGWVYMYIHTYIYRYLISGDSLLDFYYFEIKISRDIQEVQNVEFLKICIRIHCGFLEFWYVSNCRFLIILTQAIEETSKNLASHPCQLYTRKSKKILASNVVISELLIIYLCWFLRCFFDTADVIEHQQHQHQQLR